MGKINFANERASKPRNCHRYSLKTTVYPLDRRKQRHVTSASFRKIMICITLKVSEIEEQDFSSDSNMRQHFCRRKWQITTANLPIIGRNSIYTSETRIISPQTQLFVALRLQCSVLHKFCTDIRIITSGNHVWAKNCQIKLILH